MLHGIFSLGFDDVRISKHRRACVFILPHCTPPNRRMILSIWACLFEILCKAWIDNLVHMLSAPPEHTGSKIYVVNSIENGTMNILHTTQSDADIFHLCKIDVLVWFLDRNKTSAALLYILSLPHVFNNEYLNLMWEFRFHLDDKQTVTHRHTHMHAHVYIFLL